MRKVVVGFDGTDESKDALQLAHSLTKTAKGTLHVACIYEDELLFQDSEEAAKERTAQLARLFEEAARELSYAPFEQYMSTGSAAEGLSATVHGVDADLVVVGSSHRGRAGRIYPGSVGERLLNGTGCAVAVAPRGYARRVSNRHGVIGVAYDGGREAEEALGVAAEMAGAMKASLRLIGVVPQSHGKDHLGYYLREFREHFKQQLRQAEETLPGDVEVSSILEEGDPAEVLSERGKDLDLLVVGSRSYGPLRHVLLGGVSQPLMRTASCPVLVVPRGAKEPEADDSKTMTVAVAG